MNESNCSVEVEDLFTGSFVAVRLSLKSLAVLSNLGVVCLGRSSESLRSAEFQPLITANALANVAVGLLNAVGVVAMGVGPAALGLSVEGLCRWVTLLRYGTFELGTLAVHPVLLQRFVVLCCQPWGAARRRLGLGLNTRRARLLTFALILSASALLASRVFDQEFLGKHLGGRLGCRFGRGGQAGSLLSLAAMCVYAGHVLLSCFYVVRVRAKVRGRLAFLQDWGLDEDQLAARLRESRAVVWASFGQVLLPFVLGLTRGAVLLWGLEVWSVWMLGVLMLGELTGTAEAVLVLAVVRPYRLAAQAALRRAPSSATPPPSPLLPTPPLQPSHPSAQPVPTSVSLMNATSIRLLTKPQNSSSLASSTQDMQGDVTNTPGRKPPLSSQHQLGKQQDMNAWARIEGGNAFGTSECGAAGPWWELTPDLFPWSSPPSSQDGAGEGGGFSSAPPPPHSAAQLSWPAPQSPAGFSALSRESGNSGQWKPICWALASEEPVRSQPSVLRLKHRDKAARRARHSQVERERRLRIRAHLRRLGEMVPTDLVPRPSSQEPATADVLAASIAFIADLQAEFAEMKQRMKACQCNSPFDSLRPTKKEMEPCEASLELAHAPQPSVPAQGHRGFPYKTTF